ncbi:hypothetical protein EIL87_25470 [Saccharopolyspora rhizosphaerae]|uniref:Uncharacterized protein n=1 Tax=Saccharopolyspora rhizosphaerae TaxID=2492662 RepID=A0A3R8Q4N1_9PSEU|nr:hypothetical protein [Saccharopolyspora rhizosphaerae]RRO13011.1 hypothetical protein EIL87_25470 [Saccharopolyspora rhizosphaerae]
MLDPYHVQVDTTDLAELTRALQLLDTHADLNDRYRKMLHESLAQLAEPQIRLTQARGLAKRLMVLLKAAGPDLEADLPPEARVTLEAGRAQADDLVFRPDDT